MLDLHRRQRRVVEPLLSASVDVTVRRNDDGGLGVVVDQDNTVVTVSAQPSLQVGDVIIAVDGEALNSRPVGQCLTPGKAEYEFSISRPSADRAAESLEKVLLTLARDQGGIIGSGPPCIVCPAEEDLADRLESVVASLEADGGPRGQLSSASDLDAALAGGSFWRLIVTSDATVASGGLTGFGLAPYCSVLASFQFFKPQGEADPTSQVVEVVANANMGASNLAALKGGWIGADADSAEAHAFAGTAGAHAAAIQEVFTRTEYQNQPLAGADEVVSSYACTYVSKRLRVARVRGGEEEGTTGAWRVYQRLRADVAQNEIARLLSLPVKRDESEVPDWATRDDRLGGGGFGSGGGGGYEPQPMPMPDSGRM